MTEESGPVLPPRVGAGGSARPVALSEVAPHFEIFAQYARVVLAVSGGPDSTALLLLAAAWCGARRTTGAAVPDFEVVTVDHALRPRSRDEARFVAALCSRLGLRHTTLVWQGEKPTASIMAEARAARYRLLADFASGLVPAAIATAHTEDDQGETVLMRLARGSGLDGLAGMAVRRPSGLADRVDLVRPLLAFGKARLRATLEDAGETWVEDPSNENCRFERVRLRAAREPLAIIGLTNENLARSAARLRRVQEVVEATTGAFIAREVDVHEGIFGSLEREAFSAAPEEIRIRVLSRLLGAFGGAAEPARLVEVEDLAARLLIPGLHRITLGGCVVSAGERFLRIYREHSRAPLPVIPLTPGERSVWDERFEVAADPAAGGEVIVRGLGDEGYATLLRRGSLRFEVPQRAAAGLPSFWTQGGRLISVPQLGYSGPDGAGVVPDQGQFRARFLGLAGGPPGDGGRALSPLQSKPG